MLTLSAVTKRYGPRLAVDRLDLLVEEGEILGLLGPNGAGKSTTVGLAMGLLLPDQGRVEVRGVGAPDLPASRRALGLAPQAVALYELLTGEENLRFFGRLQGLSGHALETRVDEALAFVGLADRRRDRVETYSGGMKRRLNLAAAILHRPRLLLLDEPTVGVDPQSRNQLFENVVELRRRGTTIIYTTHYMEEAERLCDRLAIIDHGRLLDLDRVPVLLRRHGGEPTLVVERERGEQRIPTEDPVADLARLAAGAHADGRGEIRSFRVERTTLEAVFLRLTGRSLRD